MGGCCMWEWAGLTEPGFYLYIYSLVPPVAVILLWFLLFYFLCKSKMAALCEYGQCSREPRTLAYLPTNTLSNLIGSKLSFYKITAPHVAFVVRFVDRLFSAKRFCGDQVYTHGDPGFNDWVSVIQECDALRCGRVCVDVLWRFLLCVLFMFRW